MSGRSVIEWCDATWNPTVGCTRCSPGCAHCYAFELHDRRHAAHLAGKAVPRQYAKPFQELQLLRDRLEDPLHWKKPRRIFVNSMSDLFHEDVHRDFILQVFMVMRQAPWHTFQVLTKRAARARWLLTEWLPAAEALADASLVVKPPAPNIWLGVSVEDRRHGLPRVEHLRATPARVRFLSVEPLLEDLGAVNLDGIGWVIVGGESGSHARPCNLEWVRSLVQQCRGAGVACFVKQLGAHPVEVSTRDYAAHPSPGVHGSIKSLMSTRECFLRDRKGGDPAEWSPDLRVREFPY